MTSRRPFDAVLVVAFGGPQGLADIRPFLANVLRGRRIPPERVEEVAGHYEHFGGVSPLTDVTMRQADGLRSRLKERGVELPVYVGMRNWHPLLPDTLGTMAKDGVRRAIGFICAAHRSYSSCTQYRENVADAKAQNVAAGHADVSVTYVDDWHTHEGFVGTNARHAAEAIATLPEEVRGRARLVFTAHSIPTTMAAAERYQSQLLESARLVAERLGRDDWALVFQSRSGRPSDPWLEPDVCAYLRAERAKGLEAAVLMPDRLRLRSHRSALRPGRRGRGRLPRGRSAHGSSAGGQRRSGVHGLDGRRRAREPMRASAADARCRSSHLALNFDS